MIVILRSSKKNYPDVKLHVDNFEAENIVCVCVGT